MTRLRKANNNDADALTVLLSQLGYPCTPDVIPARIRKFADNPDVLLTVAERENEVVGIVTGHVIDGIHRSDPVAMLTTLVVLEHARGLGIGRELVAHVEDWARGRGATTITLTSALRRAGAHEFYRRLGYEHTGLRLVKTFV